MTVWPLAEVFGCKVTGIDHSSWMVETAKRKTEERGLVVEFENGDAHDLPFDAETFDLVISEGTTCALEKQKAFSGKHLGYAIVVGRKARVRMAILVGGTELGRGLESRGQGRHSAL